MLLSQVILALLAVIAVIFVPLRLAAAARLSVAHGSNWVSAAVATMIVFAFVALMSARSLGFGVDTGAYAEVFAEYCSRGVLDDHEASFVVSALLLNVSMLGACQVPLMPAVWVSLIAVSALAMAAPWSLRVRYAAVLLLSLVGVELATNALRQGLSVGVMLLSVSAWPRRRFWSMVFGIAAIALHSSAALVLLGIGLSMLGWPSFISALLALTAGVYFALDSGVDLVLIQPFLYEIQKYLGHEADELWIRVLSLACVAAAVSITAVLARHRPVHQGGLECNRDWGVALRLAMTCLPFLSLPYFGYRYIYGVYPIVLFLVMRAGTNLRIPAGRHFVWLLSLNIAVLLAWSLGSRYMREIPFFD